MLSILIPTYNNFDYFKLCIKSLETNTNNKYEIIVHVNDGIDGTLDFVKNKSFKYVHSKTNIGLCSSINKIAKISNYKYLLYSHDDMFFCPGWDNALINEIKKIGHNNFYLSGTMIEPDSGHIKFNAGKDFNSFNEQKLLDNVDNLNFFDHQGSHFAPHLVHKDLWDKVGGFSEEFNPGIGSDPDFNMKLWHENVRIFKGINKFKVYHFSSITSRNKKKITQNKGDITFLKKWKITTKFFKKHYLKSKSKYICPLNEPDRNIIYYIDLFICKINLLYVKVFKK
tara:strand:- start:23 stop:871 length:849 start_codon:yes stop_codon:yes gene_type:complete